VDCKRIERTASYNSTLCFLFDVHTCWHSELEQQLNFHTKSYFNQETSTKSSQTGPCDHNDYLCLSLQAKKLVINKFHL